MCFKSVLAGRSGSHCSQLNEVFETAISGAGEACSSSGGPRRNPRVQPYPEMRELEERVRALLPSPQSTAGRRVSRESRKQFQQPESSKEVHRSE
jgi:hypothetical protein